MDESTDSIFKTALSVAVSAPRELSEEEKFAMCVAAGVPIESEMEDRGDGKFVMKMKTKYPCAVFHTGERWQIATNPNL